MIRNWGFNAGSWFPAFSWGKHLPGPPAAPPSTPSGDGLSPGDPPAHDPLGFLLASISAKEVAAIVADKKLSGELTARADRAISEFIDDYCGTGHNPIPWPWPGPPPWVLGLVYELMAAANRVEAGFMRTELHHAAAQIIEKSLKQSSSTG